MLGMFGQWVLPTEYSRANAFVCEGSNLGVLVAFPVRDRNHHTSYSSRHLVGSGRPEPTHIYAWLGLPSVITAPLSLWRLRSLQVTSLLCRYYSWRASFVLPGLAAIPCAILLCALGELAPYYCTTS